MPPSVLTAWVMKPEAEAPDSPSEPSDEVRRDTSAFYASSTRYQQLANTDSLLGDTSNSVGAAISSYFEGFHTANEAHFAALALQSREHANQERALVLFKDHRLHIGQVDDHVHDGEAGIWELLGDHFHRGRLGESNAHNRI